MKGFSILLIAATFVGGALVGVLLLRSGHSTLTPQIVTRPFVLFEGNTEPLFVAIVDTDALREQGLSGAAGLGTAEGMLFLFEYPGRMAFWMKDMRFPIDIIWIGSDWKVADITRNLSPETYPKTFSPTADAQYVLEVNAGFAAAQNIQIGQSVIFKK